MVAIQTIQLEQQQGALSEKLRSNLRRETNTLVPFIILMTFAILALLVGLSVTSVYYNGLKNVFASLDLPDITQTIDGSNPTSLDNLLLLDHDGSARRLVRINRARPPPDIYFQDQTKCASGCWHESRLNCYDSCTHVEKCMVKSIHLQQSVAFD